MTGRAWKVILPGQDRPYCPCSTLKPFATVCPPSAVLLEAQGQQDTHTAPFHCQKSRAYGSSCDTRSVTMKTTKVESPFRTRTDACFESTLWCSSTQTHEGQTASTARAPAPAVLMPQARHSQVTFGRTLPYKFTSNSSRHCPWTAKGQLQLQVISLPAASSLPGA